MKKYLVLLLVGLFILMMTVNLYADNNEGLAILQKSDAAFIPNEAKFKFRTEAYENDQYKRYYLSQVYLKGNDRYLLVGTEPPVLKGMVQLRIGDVINNYMKKIDKVQQLSAKVAFYDSTLSQEDVMSSKLATFYKLESFAKSQEKGEDIYILNMIASSKEVAYYKIISYVNAQTYLPIRREYFAFSGQKIKEMTIEDVQKGSDGRVSLIKFTMTDVLRKGVYTKVTMSDFDYSKAMSNTFFTKTYMKIAAN